MADKGQIFPSRYLLNVTIWTSVEALKNFTYQGQHLQAIKDRANWFVDHDLPKYVLWWASTEEVITEKRVYEKLLMLKHNGVTAGAFTFKQTYS